jgi:hypothetical protein
MLNQSQRGDSVQDVTESDFVLLMYIPKGESAIRGGVKFSSEVDKKRVLSVLKKNGLFKSNKLEVSIM